MKKRVGSALLLVPLTIFIFLGGMPLLLMAFVIGAMAMAEFADGFAKIGVKTYKAVGWACLALLYIIYAHMIRTGLPVADYQHYMLFWVFVVVAAGLLLMLFTKDQNISNGPVTMLSVLYIGFFSSHVVLIDHLEQGAILVWLALLTAFGTDIFAYLIGIRFGKRKLCPALSPKKTVEGALGGLAGSILLCTIFGWVILPELILHCALIGLIGSIFAQMGDLVASAFKRKMGIKDYGNLIPGHGGILDRFDSILFTLPVVYYYTTLIIYNYS
ncbi:MAG TPA: phosphatidate cytidylyltransferase [Clostridiales bacterium]|jgi:phosphatidate cytidylyltransferase|nr:phosphatidate cytidylyltransferase [Clostridiales bacterium]